MTDAVPDPRLKSLSDLQLRELYDFRGLQAEDIVRELVSRNYKLQRKESESKGWQDTRFSPNVTERFVKATGCGYSEPESGWRDPDTGKHRIARCEGGSLISRGNGLDSFTDGAIFMTRRPCPRCEESAL